MLSVILAWPDANMHLIFCDVGQGDGILLTYKFSQLIVDAGPPNGQFMDCLLSHMPWWDRTLEVVVASHADADHIGGLEAVFQAYAIDSIYWNGDGKDTAVFTGFYQSLQRKQRGGTEVRVLKQGDRVPWVSGVTVLTLLPRVEDRSTLVLNNPVSETTLQDIKKAKTGTADSANDLSIALKVTVGRVATFLMGDVPSTKEMAIPTSTLTGEISILKVAHHGSKSSTSPDFIRLTAPEISILSVGKNNPYGHPAPEVIDRLVSSGSQIIRTDESGSVELLTNGQSVWRKQ